MTKIPERNQTLDPVTPESVIWDRIEFIKCHVYLERETKVPGEMEMRRTCEMLDRQQLKLRNKLSTLEL